MESHVGCFRYSFLSPGLYVRIQALDGGRCNCATIGLHAVQGEGVLTSFRPSEDVCDVVRRRTIKFMIWIWTGSPA